MMAFWPEITADFTVNDQTADCTVPELMVSGCILVLNTALMFIKCAASYRMIRMRMMMNKSWYIENLYEASVFTVFSDLCRCVCGY